MASSAETEAESSYAASSAGENRDSLNLIGFEGCYSAGVTDPSGAVLNSTWTKNWAVVLVVALAEVAGRERRNRKLTTTPKQPAVKN